MFQYKKNTDRHKPDMKGKKRNNDFAKNFSPPFGLNTLAFYLVVIWVIAIVTKKIDAKVLDLYIEKQVILLKLKVTILFIWIYRLFIQKKKFHIPVFKFEI